MTGRGFKAIDLRYKSVDTGSKIYKQIREKEKQYFETTGFTRGANTFFWYKIASLVAVVAAAYYFMVTTASVAVLFGAFTTAGVFLMLLGINVGHDAAHHAVTRKPYIDNTLFRIIFGIQGLSGYVWQIRHNNSHHVMPNVTDQDSDMDMGSIIVLEPHQKKSWYHQYQHLYAPIIYFFAGFVLLVLKDYEMMSESKQGNLRIGKIPPIEWAKFVLVKVVHLTLFIGIPAMFSSFSLSTILSAFIAMHMATSIFMMFIFVISHHVEEVAHIETASPTMIDDIWVKHQIVSAIDFNENSPFANYLFGGFNLHIAHHIFPGVSHVHYPALTQIIKETLEENGVGDWYRSYSFFDGCRSHLRFLKKMGRAGEAPDDVPLFT